MSRGDIGKQRPKAWIFPNDPVKNQAYLCYLRAKAQAKFRKEFWEFSFEDWWAMWEASGQWHNKGKKAHEYCMMQHDTDQGWTKANAYVATRAEHYRTQHKRRKQGTPQPEWDSRDRKFLVPRGATGDYKRYDYEATVAGLRRYHGTL
jgi:hypothetical protein